MCETKLFYDIANHFLMSITGLWTSKPIVNTILRLKAVDLSFCLLLQALFKDLAWTQ